MAAILTIAAAVTHEGEKVKGSRFIADLAPAPSEVAALAFLEEVRAREVGATRHCWAFRLQDGRARSSDDGEPAGTAGAPMLADGFAAAEGFGGAARGDVGAGGSAEGGRGVGIG